VRVAAQRALRGRYAPEDPPAAELVAYLDRNADQPQAAFERGTWMLEHRYTADALPWLEKAVRWDPSAPQAWHALAITRAALGDGPGAEAAMARARALMP